MQELAEPKENLVVAPFGVAVNLAMVLEGARGPAAAELRAALGLNGTQRDAADQGQEQDQDEQLQVRMRTGFRAVLARFQATADHEDVSGAFTAATLHSSRQLPDQYRALLEDYYLAQLSTEDDNNTAPVEHSEEHTAELNGESRRSSSQPRRSSREVAVDTGAGSRASTGTDTWEGGRGVTTGS